ncbi:Protein of unknown function [Cotesia congregata]|uniref:Uncharacterized protein n=1 Tax=Cotesia congregata TaxID=51543 RepID=A0A8J2HI15_COTCN|nr:Protein of unknown function [Cotesia congregata]
MFLPRILLEDRVCLILITWRSREPGVHGDALTRGHCCCFHGLSVGKEYQQHCDSMALHSSWCLSNYHAIDSPIF